MTPLVLVHGFMGGAAQWDSLRPYLADKIELVTLDLPGFGANANVPPLNRIEAFAAWVIAALRDRGIKRYALLGHSMGGMIAQEIARRDAAAIDRLILYATGPVGVIPGRFETIATSKARAQSDGPVPTARRIAATWFLESEAAPAYPACAAIAEQATLDAILTGLDAMEAWSGRDRLAQIEAETLILWGDKDRTYNWDQTLTLWTQIPHTHLAVVPACAHAVHMEKPARVAALIDDFLGLT